MSPEFKKIARLEIEEFKAELRQRFPGRDVEKITDEDLLREVMNTVGKPGKLGEHVKCVVSVSMLTEGWDAKTVTHILGVRAFGTQLLCEQVVGRGLRRRNYETNAKGMFEPEYAEVYGVPFSFLPVAAATPDVIIRPTTHVQALEERAACEITFPRVAGYRYDLPVERLSARFSKDSLMTLTTERVPFWTENAPIVGESSIQTLDDLKTRRLQEVAFLLAKLTLEKYFRCDGQHQTDRAEEHRFDSEVQTWRFPDLLAITRRWLDECLVCKDNTFPQMLLLIEWAHDAADKIYLSIVASAEGTKTLKPILQPYNTVGSTRYVDFETARPVYATHPDFCHVSHVVADTESWEQKMAQALEELGAEGLVFSYVKNHNVGFAIPYSIRDDERLYFPDFIVRLDDGHGREDPLNLILEVSGLPRPDKAAKVSHARSCWVPAINNHGAFGRWAFIEIEDPWCGKKLIREKLALR
jgi:type III restriction enzyme